MGENGLEADVEGLAIYYFPDGKGYLLVASQGSNTFNVYERSGNHAFVGTFSVKKAKDTDGIDVTNVNLNHQFPNGMFVCHSGADRPYPVFLVSWEGIGNAYKNGDGSAAP